MAAMSCISAVGCKEPPYPRGALLSKFSAHIWKIIHIVQYSRSDLMYAVNRLSIHAPTPSLPAFQRIKHLVR